MFWSLAYYLKVAGFYTFLIDLIKSVRSGSSLFATNFSIFNLVLFVVWVFLCWDVEEARPSCFLIICRFLRFLTRFRFLFLFLVCVSVPASLSIVKVSLFRFDFNSNCGKRFSIFWLFIETFRGVAFHAKFFLALLSLFFHLLQLWVNGGGVNAFANIFSDVFQNQLHIACGIIIEDRRPLHFHHLLLLFLCKEVLTKFLTTINELFDEVVNLDTLGWNQMLMSLVPRVHL